jgi:hypothetical protein
VDGKILETPGEPPESTLKDRLYHGAYPAREFGGIVFAYMGPPDKKPAFPMYDWYDQSGYELYCPGKNLYPCNWLQIIENDMDPVHTTFLHARVSGLQDRSTPFLKIGTLDWMETPVGMIYMHTRRSGDLVFVRMNDNILPNAAQAAGSSKAGLREGLDLSLGPLWAVPVDDYNSMKFRIRHYPEGTVPSYELSPGITGERTYEEKQRKPDDYEAQTGQRPIAIHDLEHLGSTDKGVIMFRRQVRNGIRAVQEGKDPLGINRRDGEAIPTYCSNTVMRVPPAPTPEADRELLLSTGRKLAESYLKTPPLVVSRNRGR